MRLLWPILCAATLASCVHRPTTETADAKGRSTPPATATRIAPRPTPPPDFAAAITPSEIAIAKPTAIDDWPPRNRKVHVRYVATHRTDVSMTNLDVVSQDPRVEPLSDLVTLEVVSTGPCALRKVTFSWGGEEKRVLRGPWSVEVSLPVRSEFLDSWSVDVIDACDHEAGVIGNVIRCR